MIALIHYGEIGLKGGNRKYFEERLASNVRKVLGSGVKVRVDQKRLFAEGKFTEKNAREKLGKVFGIEWFAVAEECAPETEAIWKCVKKNVKLVGGKKFAVRAKRSDKNFPVGSVELSGELGKRILDSVDAKVDLKNPEITVFVEIMQGKALVFFEKIK
ncbi:tRNA 4-thiouridine(8) synthase ThiI, partial [Candidatus Micrarchaeota archaeon]|nr:tRNA 4-thiouridine(8) synthase ThiI [Candidatus Micrarchaeota archaeon]MBD3418086.1 tRNA 4-thiouridine(8) synthase ThiI [Candidatus Micrarchaeota archaeon]